MTPAPERATARLVIIDPRDRILLIRYWAARIIDPARPEERGVWFTPGGGIDPGETPEEAARRELHEETGLSGLPIGPCIATRSALVDIFARVAFTHERYFLVRTPSDHFDNSRLAETDFDPVIDMRWRDRSEMTTSREFILPEGLPALYLRILDGDLPQQPLVLA
jgi:8-oxo-dGTP pyrophosphatase MutT (NUDIX family)